MAEKTFGKDSKMVIEAPYSKYRKQNFLIAIGVCLLASVIFGYDGYLSKYEWSGRQSFYEEHTKDGVPNDTMKFNQLTPLVLVPAAVVCALLFFKVKNKKITADENELIISKSEKIPYSAIQKIDKTNFATKGFFVVTYTKDGSEVNCKISNRSYDNLKPILEHLVSKIV